MPIPLRLVSLKCSAQTAARLRAASVRTAAALLPFLPPSFSARAPWHSPFVAHVRQPRSTMTSRLSRKWRASSELSVRPVYSLIDSQFHGRQDWACLPREPNYPQFVCFCNALAPLPKVNDADLTR